MACFLFKQKTAYEMRISDWSSDVCSSDLSLHRATPTRHGCQYIPRRPLPISPVFPPCPILACLATAHITRLPRKGNRLFMLYAAKRCVMRFRSEEHTSELQSLMRISYAVFCLKKKTITIQHRPHTFTNTTIN